ncbi:hypothetical protein FRB99_008184 [Tulasnella sp. 403]|nr:hypothetical protein FRB99_008184 [Tulasnella sp. 403]
MDLRPEATTMPPPMGMIPSAMTSTATIVAHHGAPLGDRTDTIDTVVAEPIPPELNEKKGDEKQIDLERQAAPSHDVECSWPILIACAIIVSITQGWGFVFGVFQPWFQHHLLSPTMSDSLIVMLPTTQAMLTYIAS